MTEASYTAWDDNDYLWPPPEGWYQSSDGKWWPEGYGPPAAAADEDVQDSGPAPEELIDADSEAESAPAQRESAETEPRVRFEAANPVAGPPIDGLLFDSGPADSAPARPIPLDELPIVEAPDVEIPPAENPVNGATVYSPGPAGPPVANVEPAHSFESAPETIAIPSNDGRLEFGRGAAAAVSIPDPQKILGAKAKGSSRGLLIAIAGALVLVAIGVGLYVILGGDEDPAESVTPVATGPGSLNEPHPRASGVVVFYPDGDTDQRWIVEVLEPVRDATVELGGSDSVTFAATRLRIRNESGAELASIGDLRFDVVDATDTVIVRTDNQCPAVADDLNFEASVPVGSTVDGTVCWAIPGQNQDIDGLKLGIASPKVQGRVHISLQ